MLSFSTQAQLPDSVAITTDGSWYIQHSSTTYGYSSQSGSYQWITTSTFYYYRSGADTLINGIPYTQLLQQHIIPDGNGAYSISPWSSEQFVLAYRNDMNRRAYKVDPGSTTESLWYDFNPGLGDTLWNPVAPVSTPYYVVNGIDSFDYCGTMYEQFSYDDSSFQTSPSTQRVGRSINFIRSYESVFETDVIVSFCEESIPFASIAGVDEASTEDLFHLFPNPAEDVITVSHSANSNSDIVISVFDLTGQRITIEHVSEPNNGQNTLQLNISNLPKGSYFIRVQKNNGVVQTERFIKQ